MSKSKESLTRSHKSTPLDASELLPLVYEELRGLARRYMRREKEGQSLQATALVHEAYLRLVKEKRKPWQNRNHFLAIAAISMRQILVERARARAARKRGGSRVRVTLGEEIAAEQAESTDVLALDEALIKLAEIDPQLVRLVELRYFGGLSIDEAAAVTGVSAATVKRSWNIARAWLKRELTEHNEPK
jgi:RNA polymerase sigma-70 factor, ECF subfamily